MQDDMNPAELDQPEGEPVPTGESTPEPEAPRSRKAVWLAMGAVALALGLIWVAPGIEPHDETAPGAQADFPGEPEDAQAAGQAANLDFTLKDMHGVDVQLASFKGKVILLNFWATWCGPCRAEIPSLVELQEQYKDDLVVLGLSVDDTADKLLPYAAEFKMNYPVLVGLDRDDLQDAYGPMWGIPTTFVISRDGRICRKNSGLVGKAKYETDIKGLL